MKKKIKKTPDGYPWVNTLGLEAEAKRMETALAMSQDVVALLRSERDRYRKALMSISRYPNCPRGIYSILLDSLEGDHEEPVLFSFDGWYKEGVRLGYCSVQFCSTHDGAPMHESEERAWDEGHDPCCHVVRLGEPSDWNVGDL